MLPCCSLQGSSPLGSIAVGDGKGPKLSPAGEDLLAARELKERMVPFKGCGESRTMRKKSMLQERVMCPLVKLPSPSLLGTILYQNSWEQKT